MKNYNSKQQLFSLLWAVEESQCCSLAFQAYIHQLAHSSIWRVLWGTLCVKLHALPCMRAHTHMQSAASPVATRPHKCAAHSKQVVWHVCNAVLQPWLQGRRFFLFADLVRETTCIGRETESSSIMWQSKNGTRRQLLFFSLHLSSSHAKAWLSPRDSLRRPCCRAAIALLAALWQ